MEFELVEVISDSEEESDKDERIEKEEWIASTPLNVLFTGTSLRKDKFYNKCLFSDFFPDIVSPPPEKKYS